MTVTKGSNRSVPARRNGDGWKGASERIRLTVAVTR